MIRQTHDLKNRTCTIKIEVLNFQKKYYSYEFNSKVFKWREMMKGLIVNVTH